MIETEKPIQKDSETSPLVTLARFSVAISGNTNPSSEEERGCYIVLRENNFSAKPIKWTREARDW
jgi:hypothetical protein